MTCLSQYFELYRNEPIPLKRVVLLQRICCLAYYINPIAVELNFIRRMR